MPTAPELLNGKNRLWEPRVSEIIDEALERAQINKEATSSVVRNSAVRSLQLMQTQWAAAKGYLPSIFEYTFMTVPGQERYILPPGTLSVITASARDRYDDADVMLRSLSYEEWQNLPKLDRNRSQERPYEYFLDLKAVKNGGPELRFYYTPDFEYEMNFVLQMQPEVVQGQNQTLETAQRWYEAVCAELAARICEKFGDMERCAMLQQKAQMAVAEAKHNDTTAQPIKTTYRRWL